MAGTLCWSLVLGDEVGLDAGDWRLVARGYDLRIVLEVEAELEDRDWMLFLEDCAGG